MSKQFSRDNLDHFVAMTDLFRQSLNGSREIPLDSRRVDAMKRFSELGFPTTKHEDWKYTNVASIRKLDAKPVIDFDPSGVDVDALRKAGYNGEGWHLRFVNGHYVDAASDTDGLPEGVEVLPLREAIDRYTDLVTEHIASYPEEFEHSFALLNTAHLRDGAFVRVAKGVRLEKPIHVHYHTVVDGDPVATFPRSLFLFEQESEGTVVEEFGGREGDIYLTAAVSEVSVGDQANVTHVKLQNESRSAYHVGTSYTDVAANANYFNNGISFGAALSRNDPWAVLNGEGSHAAVDGLYVVDGDRLIDNHTTIDHTVPHCTSHELYKGILTDKGHGVFNGKIYVRQDAQKTDSEQSNMNLLLSSGAEIDTKPQLEIFADDVKCTHGATIGRISEESLFYLQTRGIGREKAKRMLTHAFAAEVLDHIRDEAIREYASTLLDGMIVIDDIETVKA